MKFRKMIFVLTIAFTAIFVSMLGTSYAYYVVSDGTTINVTTGNMDTNVSVVFEQSQYINFNTGVPIAEGDVDDLASVSAFTLKTGTETLEKYDIAVNVGISDLYIDESLRVDDFKYKLWCFYEYAEGTGIVGEPLVISSGTGANITDKDIENRYFLFEADNSISEMLNLSINDNSIECELDLWLQETGENQNHLMNKKFRGVIKVDTLYKNK